MHATAFNAAVMYASASGGMVDALASGASVLRDVEVRVFSRVPHKKEINHDLFFNCLSRYASWISRTGGDGGPSIIMVGFVK